MLAKLKAMGNNPTAPNAKTVGRTAQHGGNMPKCLLCKFGLVQDDGTMLCRRYPSFISKFADDWCGEYVAAKQSVHPTLLTPCACGGERHART